MNDDKKLIEILLHLLNKQIDIEAELHVISITVDFIAQRCLTPLHQQELALILPKLKLLSRQTVIDGHALIQQALQQLMKNDLGNIGGISFSEDV